MNLTLTFLTALLLTLLTTLQAAEPFPTPATLGEDYDPNQGDFKEEVVKVETKDGIFNRDAYISAYVLGEEIRVYCRACWWCIAGWALRSRTRSMSRTAGQ